MPVQLWELPWKRWRCLRISRPPTPLTVLVPPVTALQPQQLVVAMPPLSLQVSPHDYLRE